MKFQTIHLKFLVVLILFFCFGIESFGQAERPIRISPIQIAWDSSSQQFNAYFDVANDTTEDVDLTSIIIFKIGKRKRWRGSHLPGVKSHSTESFKISFSPGIMLKNEYFSITVNIYGKDYVGLLDYSSRHVNLSSRRIIDQEGTKIELTETPPLSLTELKEKVAKEEVKKPAPLQADKTAAEKKAEEEEKETVVAPAPAAKKPVAETGRLADVVAKTAKKTLIIMGPAKERVQLLATEQFQNVELKKVSPEEKKKVVEAVIRDIPPPKPPAAPENLAVSPGKLQNRLSWNAVQGATSYNIYWGTAAGVSRENGEKIENVSSGYTHSGLTGETPVYYIVTAVRDDLESKPSGEAAGRPLAPPGQAPVIAATPEKRQNRINFNPVEGAESYNLYWSKTAGVTPETGNRIADVSDGFIHTDLTDGKTVYYILTAEKDGLESQPSAEIAARPLAPPSEIPVLEVTPEKQQNRLNWRPVGDATTYHLYWGLEAGVTPENGTRIPNVESGYAHQNLTDDSVRYYMLTAEKDGIEGQPSTVVSAKPLIPPSQAPVLSAAPEKFQNRLSWQAVPGVTKYNLYWSKTSGVTPETGIRVENVTSGFAHSGLEKSEPFYYVVTAKRDGFESAPSNEVTATPVVPPKNVPQLAVKVGDSSLDLSWNAVPGATGYHLYWGTVKDFEAAQDRKLVVQGNEFRHTSLQNEQTYFYRLAAVNQDGEGELSPTVGATPVRLEATVAELLEGVQMDDFRAIKTDSALLVTIADVNLERQESLKRAEELKELDISSRDKLISMYIAEGKSESVAKVLSGQLSKEPENLNLSLSLSKVLHEQGDIKAALKVLNSSLNRISLSARIALNQELKTSVRKGESTLTTKSEEAYLADEFSRLGISLLERKKYVEALSAFQSLYSLSQDYPMVKYYLGLSRHGMKQYNQAKQLFVEQAEVDLQKQQLMDDLAALTLVLASTLDIPTIKDTRGRYVKMQEDENTPQESQSIVKQIATLDALLAEAEKRRLAGLPDLAIAMADTFSRTALQPGQKIKFSFVATNFGKKQSEPFRVYYQLKHEQGMTFDIAGFDRFKALKAKQDKTSWEKEILVPDAVVPGTYQLIANIEQTDGKGEVTFDNNKTQSAPEVTVILPKPDLEIKFAEKLPAQPFESGQTIELDVVVTNIGFKDSSPFEVNYFLENKDGDKVDLKVTDKQKGIQKGNKQVSWKKQLPITEKLDEGSYRIVAEIKMAKKAAEQNKENNSTATGFNLTYTPPFTDMMLAWEQEPPGETIVAGHTFSATVKVENKGNSSSSKGKIVYKLIDDSGDEIDLEEESTVPTLEKGQGPITLTSEFQLPEKMDPGNYRLYAGLELDDDDLERNEGNNQVTSESRMTIEASYSDLTVMLKIAEQEQPIRPGETITVKAELKNPGNRDLENITVRFSLNNRSGDEYPVGDAAQVISIKADSVQSLEMTVLIPADLEEGVYRVSAEAEIADDEFEKNEANNADDSAYVFSYLKPKPVEPVEPPVQAADEQIPAEEQFQETEEQRVTNWVRHAAAISLAVVGAQQAMAQDEKYKAAQDREDDLEAQYSSSQSASEVSVIESRLDDNRSQMELYAQNTNMWTTLALVGVGWEVYNIFFCEPEQAAAPSGDGFQLRNKWAHASAVGIAALAFWQSQSEVQKYNDLSDENDGLKAQYSTASTEAEVSAIRNQIASNESRMENHINNANIFDGVTLLALGFESYLIWKAFSDPDADIVKLRYDNMDGFQLKPLIAYEKVGLNLNYNW